MRTFDPNSPFALTLYGAVAICVVIASVFVLPTRNASVKRRASIYFFCALGLLYLAAFLAAGLPPENLYSVGPAVAFAVWISIRAFQVCQGFGTAFIYRFSFIGLVLVGFTSGTVTHHVQDEVLKNHQTTQASPQNPVKLTLKGRDFNVTRQFKELYENGEMVFFVSFLLGALVYVGGGLYKTNPATSSPLGSPLGTSTPASRSRPMNPSDRR